MKRALLTLVILVLFSFATTEVYATKFFGSHQKVIKIYDLPNTEDYTSTDGKLFNFGYKYSLFYIAFLPVFEIGQGKIVGYIDDDNYVLLSDDDIINLAKNNEIENLSDLVKIPFWDEWGGKIAGVILLFFLLILFIHRRNKL